MNSVCFEGFEQTFTTTNNQRRIAVLNRLHLIFAYFFVIGFLLLSSSCGNSRFVTQILAVSHTGTISQYCELQYDTDSQLLTYKCYCEITCNGTTLKKEINCQCSKTSSGFECVGCDSCNSVTCPVEGLSEPLPEGETTPTDGGEVLPEAVSEQPLESLPEIQSEQQTEQVPEAKTCTLTYVTAQTGLETIQIPKDFVEANSKKITISFDPYHCNNRWWWKGTSWYWPGTGETINDAARTVLLEDISYVSLGSSPLHPSQFASELLVLQYVQYKTVSYSGQTLFYVDIPKDKDSNGRVYDLMVFRRRVGEVNNYSADEWIWYTELSPQNELIRASHYDSLIGKWLWGNNN